MNVRAKVLQFLRAQPGAWRTWREIGDHVFADDPQGGPLDMRRSVYRAVYDLRRHGYSIEHRGAFGYRWIPCAGVADWSTRNARLDAAVRKAAVVASASDPLRALVSWRANGVPRMFVTMIKKGMTA